MQTFRLTDPKGVIFSVQSMDGFNFDTKTLRIDNAGQSHTPEDRDTITHALGLLYMATISPLPVGWKYEVTGTIEKSVDTELVKMQTRAQALAKIKEVINSGGLQLIRDKPNGSNASYRMQSVHAIQEALNIYTLNV